MTARDRSTRARAGLLAAALLALAAVPNAAVAFDLQAHRGGRGLSPENTLAAFRAALEMGVSTLETDLGVTRDGVLVISHEQALSPDITRDVEGRWLTGRGALLSALSLDEVKRYDVGRLDPASRYARQWPEQRPRDGERIPTLTELFALVASSAKPVRLNIETKITPTEPGNTVDPATFARKVVEAVRRAGLSNRVTVQSFDWRTLVEVRRIAPEIETACLTMQTRDLDTVKPDASGASPWHAGLVRERNGNTLPRLAKAAGCATWSMFWRNLERAQIDEARELGLAVLPWTVNDPADMARLIDWGVDGIITDYPDRLRKVMADKGLPLP